MDHDKDLLARIRAWTKRRRGFVEKYMFGGVAFLHRGNMCVGIWRDSLIARIGLSEYPLALSERHVREFDVTGRPMRGWVMVDAEGIATDDELIPWLDRALLFVRTLPAKD